MHHGFLHSGAWVILDGSPIDLPVAAAMSPTVTTAAAQLTHDDGLIDLLTTTVVPPFETAAALQLSITGMLVPARPLYGLPSNKLDLPTAASPAFGMPSSAAKALQFGVRFQLTATGNWQATCQFGAAIDVRAAFSSSAWPAFHGSSVSSTGSATVLVPGAAAQVSLWAQAESASLVTRA